MSSICETNVTLISVLAGGCWATGGVVVAVGLVMHMVGLPAIGLWISGWGGVLTMRHYFECSQGREKAAFDLGRRIGAEDAGNVPRI